MENSLNYKMMMKILLSLTYKLSSGGSKNFRTGGAVEDIPYDFIERVLIVK